MNFFDKLKLWLTILGGALITVLTYIFVRRGEKIDQLEHENSALKSDNEIKKKEGEKNEIHKQVLEKESEYDSAHSDFMRSKSEFEESRKRLPKLEE